VSAASCARLQFGFPLMIVTSDENDHWSLERILRKDCHLHRAAGRGDALSVLRRFHPWVVVCEQVLADGDWRDLLKDLQSEQQMPPPLIVLSKRADDRLWAEVLNLGGYDLLIKPFAAMEVSRVVKMAAHRGSKSGDY